MKFVAAVAAMALVLQGAEADIYMHNPPGSNNRNARTDNNDNRRNANRLFDSQNNDKGGYSARRAFPFACYKVIDNANQFNQCVNQGQANKGALNALGELKAANAVNTPMMYYFSGSELTVEFTAQHGAGANEELVADTIIQMACEDTLTDNCGPVAQGDPLKFDPSKKTCIVRDGTPVKNADGNNGLNAEATDRIPTNAADQDDMRYGRHETLAFQAECQNRERNKGLFTADQNLNGNDARFTRQNPNANRNGLECPEESEYYPYWHSSPWKDVAIITNDAKRCAFFQAESQNVKGKGRCECNGANACNGNGKKPNNPAACAAIAGAKWVTDAPFGIPPPSCVQGDYSRANHLGNAGSSGSNLRFNMTFPQVAKETRCVLRVRYNMTSTDFGGVAINADSKLNGNKSPLKDNDNNEAGGYVQFTANNAGQNAQLSYAINTDQFARTFQDRSHTFIVKPQTGANGRKLAETDGCAKIYNLNVRGKRGNIVQTYPAVEYDFVPDKLQVATNDCVHVQFSGSDYNPNRNGNNAEGGPYAANNRNKDTKSDRTNLVQMLNPGDNLPEFDKNGMDMFGDKANYQRLAFVDQPIDDPNQCLGFQALKAKFNNRANREETHLNCAKLSGVATPYFDGGVQRVGAKGTYEYMSTRNNNFSNRQQKGVLEVVSPRSAGGFGGFVNNIAAGEAGSVSIVAIVAIAGVGAAAFFVMRQRGDSGAGPAVNPYVPQAKPAMQPQMAPYGAQGVQMNPYYARGNSGRTQGQYRR